MTTVDPESSYDICKFIASKGGKYLEAQIQGSKTEAENGSLIILGAGNRDLFFECKPCFKALAKAVYHLGEVGFGSKMNLSLQVMKGVTLAGVAEGFALAESSGISIRSALEIFQLSGLNCPYLSEKASTIINKKFNDTHQSVQTMQKDLRLALEISETLIHPLILTSKANEVYKRVKSIGYETQDSSAIFMGSFVAGHHSLSPEPANVNPDIGEIEKEI